MAGSFSYISWSFCSLEKTLVSWQDNSVRIRMLSVAVNSDLLCFSSTERPDLYCHVLDAGQGAKFPVSN